MDRDAVSGGSSRSAGIDFCGGTVVLTADEDVRGSWRGHLFHHHHRGDRIGEVLPSFPGGTSCRVRISNFLRGDMLDEVRT